MNARTTNKNHPQIKCWWRPNIKCNRCGTLGHIEQVCKNQEHDKEKEEDNILFLMVI